MFYTKPELIQLACESAAHSNLDAVFLCSFIEVASQWTAAKKEWYDPGVFYGQELDNPEESYAQCFKYGLLQIPGRLAREYKYKEPLESLLEAPLNLKLGCEILSELWGKVDGDLQKVCLLWNRQQSVMPQAIESKMKLFEYFLLARGTHGKSPQPDLGTKQSDQ